ncbi:MAG: ABC transporter permease [Litorivicinus sp.]
MLSLAWASLRARAFTVGLVWLALMMSVFLLLVSDRLSRAAQDGFNRSINGVDLIVSTKTGPLETLLYSVFHIGQPLSNLDAKHLEQLNQDPTIDWAIPIALGDSHGEFRVLATQAEYFERLRDARNQPMRFAAGQAFNGPTDVVLGAQVAHQLNYQLGQSIQLSHGSGGLGKAHDDLQFRIVGILAATGTPTDQSLFVSLEAHSLLHLGWSNGRRIVPLDRLEWDSLPPLDSVTAVFVGLKNPLTLFQTARRINNEPNAAMSAVIPGVALAQLWSIVDRIEAIFSLLGGFIVIMSLLGVLALSLTALDARTREMAILRACGASPLQLAGLVMAEALWIALSAAGFAFLLTHVGSLAMSEWLTREFAITPSHEWWVAREWLLMVTVVGLTLLCSVIPAIRVFRRSLQSGLNS